MNEERHDVVGYSHPEAVLSTETDGTEWFSLAVAALQGGADEYQAVQRADHVFAAFRTRVQKMRATTGGST